MKKDFSQPLKKSGTTAYLLMQDAVSDRFVMFASKDDIQEYGSADANRTLSVTLDETQDMSQQLIKFLYSNGFALTTFREVVRQTNVVFSFVDDTPGDQHNEVAIHVQVDIVNKKLFEQGEANLLSLNDYADDLMGTLFGNRIITLGIAKLLWERGSNPEDLA